MLFTSCYISSCLLDYLEKQLDKKDMVNFKIYDVTDWTTSNYNTHIAQYLNKKRKLDNETVNRICQLIEYNMKDIFLKKSYTNVLNKLVSDTFNKIKIEHITESAV